jgi:hypothetical protein
MSSTSIGRGPAGGGNENHDGDPTRKTLGETVGEERPAGADPVVDGHPDGPGVDGSPGEPDAARSKIDSPHR